MSTQRPQSNPLHQYRGSRSITHSKEAALDEREFELLLEGAKALGRTDHYYAPDPPLAIYLMGRLGMRRGELVHMHESWINWREKQIEIPPQQPCEKGKDGDICGDCRQKARQRVEHADELTLEEALEHSWVPKTEAGIRDIYFGHDIRAQMFLERYFDSEEYTRYEASGTGVSRRVTRSAELAPGLVDDSTHPHGLRATAASHFADRDLGIYQLKQVMGWKLLSTAEAYISNSSVQTAKALDGI